MAAPNAVQTVYQTSDGQVFTDLTLAEEHQEELNLAQEFGELLAATATFTSTVHGSVRNWMVAERDQILAILQGFDYEPPLEV